MKRLIYPLAALILLAATAIAALADYRGPVDGVEMLPGVNPVVKVYDGGKIEYLIYARDMQGMTNGDLTVSYSEELELVSASAQADCENYSLNTNVGGKVYFSFMYDEENESDAVVLLKLSFICGENAEYPSVLLENIAGTYIRTVHENKVVKAAEGEAPGEDESDSTATDPEPAVITGDANGDGKVTASDARLALRASARLEATTEHILAAADFDKNGKISASEARKILRVSAKLESF